MNAAEHIVECYFRFVKKCFTLDDVKVIDGKNRQIDLLACNLLMGDQYHIESSVTHELGWAFHGEKIKDIFEKKFLGIPEKRDGAKTDYTRGLNYQKQIEDTYKSVGFDPKKVQRVLVCWITKDRQNQDEAIQYIKKQYRQDLAIISFRDEILPALSKVVSTTNYDDEVLRTLSFIKEQEKQTKKNRMMFSNYS